MKEENKKSRVKVLSLILALAMVISLVPVGSVNVGAADKVSVQAVHIRKLLIYSFFSLF